MYALLERPQCECAALLVALFLILFLFFVSVFVNWCFFVMCEFDDFFHVAGCEKDSCCEGITWEVKS